MSPHTMRRNDGYNFEPPISSGRNRATSQEVFRLKVYGKHSAVVYPKLYPKT